jgi:hypothetical protein
MQKYSTRHSRVLFIFNQLPCQNIVVGLGNFCISAWFNREAIIERNHVMDHGVYKKEGCVIPPVF